MLLIPDKGVMFIAVPKVASMAIQNSLWGHFKGVTPFNDQETSLMRFKDGHATPNELDEFALEAHIDLSAFTRRFMVVRNPWDRLVSYAAWKYPEFQQYPGTNLYNALWENNNPFLRPQSDYFKEGTTVLNFENLFEDYSRLCTEWGIEASPLIPENESYREKDYTQYYDTALRDIVAQKYSKDLELFNYSF